MPVTGKTWRCLVTEDSDVDWIILNRYLSGIEDPIDFYRAKSLEDGLFMAAQSNFDVFLLDFNMPDGNAFELLRDIGTCNESNQQSPVILMSGELNENIITDLEGAGIQDFIPKDKLSFERIRTAIRQSLEAITLDSDSEDH